MARLDEFEGLDIAVVIPCYNEEATIAQVVADFRCALPSAKVFVFDNASSDATRERAARSGAHVIFEERRGKGNVVRRMFSEVVADIYIMADGDGTYDAAAAPKMVRRLIEGRLDMVVGTRRDVKSDAGRTGHAFGNRVFNGLFCSMFGHDFTDIFSGYRAFTNRFVKSFPAISAGFEIETEMSVHASQLRMPVAELELDYGVRPDGSQSKLRTFQDGGRILTTFLMMLKETKPVVFFGWVAVLLAFASLMLISPVLVTYLETGLVPRLPTAILATGLMLVAFMSVGCGLILDSLCRSRVEAKRIVYLSLRGLPVQQ